MTDDQIRALATLGAAATIAALERRLAQLRAEFPGAAHARVELPDDTPAAAPTRSHRKRVFSAATRKKMAAAQRRRHAAAKKAKAEA